MRRHPDRPGPDARHVTPQYGGLQGGTPFDDACAADAALTGFTGALSSGSHGRLGGECSVLALASAGDVFVVDGSGKDPLPVRGNQGFGGWNRDCDPDEVIVGFAGRADDDIDQLVFVCAELLVLEAIDGGFSLGLGPPENLGAIGGLGGQPFMQTACPIGQVATVQRIRAGMTIDAFGLGCSAVALTYD